VVQVGQSQILKLSVSRRLCELPRKRECSRVSVTACVTEGMNEPL
jgi:hypothetical protein